MSKNYVVKRVFNSAVPGFEKDDAVLEVEYKKSFNDEADAAAYAEKMLKCTVVCEGENEKSIMPLYESVVVYEEEE